MHSWMLFGPLFIELIIFLKLSPVLRISPLHSPCLSFFHHNALSSLPCCFLQEELYSRYLQVVSNSLLLHAMYY